MLTNLDYKYRYRKLIFFIIILLSAMPLHAGNITLSWDPPATNTDGSPLTDLAGYKMYYGTESGNYTQSIDMGNVSEYQVNNLTDGLTYYFVTTAYNSSAIESVYSNEFSIFVSTVDTTSPVITGVQSANITSTSANISWTTDEASDTRIEYGFDTSYGNTTTLDSSMVTSHMQSINGLLSSILYHYRVISRDGSGNEAISGDYTFTTSDPQPLIHLIQYYCDSDNDEYVDVSIDGSCTGYGCVPEGCQTTPGNDCDDKTSNINPGAADSDCNGTDNNCDGTPDNSYSPTNTSCGTGACQSTGQLICSNGSVTDTCTARTPAGDDSDCNGIDDDCDGTVDEGCGCINGQTRSTTCGVGECGSTGKETCSGGVWGGDTCIPGTPSAETCDNLDNDCDGGVDEDYVITATICGTGACQSTGQIVCQSGSEVNTCVPDAPEENPETTCDDGLDNDCNGKVDEGCSTVIKVRNVLLHEDFSSGIPETWQVQGAWNTDNPCSRSIDYPFKGNYAIMDSSCVTTGIEELETRSIDTSSCNSIELDFTHQYYWHAGSIDVDISDDGGTTWTNAVSISANDGYPTPSRKKIDISSLAHAQDGRIKFKYSNNAADGFWALDNISISCQSNELEISSQIDVSTSKTMMITNTGTAALGINTIDILGNDALEFHIGENDGCSNHTLLAGETCSFDIIYMPSSTGYGAATLSILSNDPDTPTTHISLLGKASDVVNPSPEPEITINDSVAPVDDLHVPFGDKTEGHSSNQNVTITNVGSSDLMIGTVTQNNSVYEPFNILNDFCSGQILQVSSSCTITVDFSPLAQGIFNDSFDIPSNDPDENSITINLSGTGLSSDSNNPPSKPDLVAPKNKSRGLDNGKKTGFRWKKSKDPDDDTVTYDFNICRDPDMTIGCETQAVIAAVQRDTQATYFAGFGSLSTCLIFFGLAYLLSFTKKGRKFVSMSVLIISITGILFLASCGSDGMGIVGSIVPDDNIPDDEVSQLMSGFDDNTVYYWQVIAKDGKGGETYSAIWSFETK